MHRSFFLTRILDWLAYVRDDRCGPSCVGPCALHDRRHALLSVLENLTGSLQVFEEIAGYAGAARPVEVFRAEGSLLGRGIPRTGPPRPVPLALVSSWAQRRDWDLRGHIDSVMGDAFTSITPPDVVLTVFCAYSVFWKELDVA